MLSLMVSGGMLEVFNRVAMGQSVQLRHSEMRSLDRGQQAVVTGHMIVTGQTVATGQPVHNIEHDACSTHEGWMYRSIGVPCPYDSIVVRAGHHAFPKCKNDATYCGVKGLYTLYPDAPRQLCGDTKAFLKLAELCPEFGGAGPGHDSLWDAPGISELTTPLFNYIRDNHVNVLNPLHWVCNLSGDRRDT